MKYFDEDGTTIYNGDCLEVLKGIQNDSVDCVITSPPYYQLRFYSGIPDYVWGSDKSCEHEFDLTKTKLMHENRNNRSGTQVEVIGNPTGTTFINRESKIRQGFCIKCGAWKGQLGLEPTYQLYLDHMIEIMVELKRVIKPSGSIWINLGDSYSTLSGGTRGLTRCDKQYGQISHKAVMGQGFDQTKQEDYPKKSLMLIPHRFAIRCIDELGLILRNDVIWSKRNGMPESVTDRFSKKHEFIFFFVKEQKYYFDLDSIRSKNSISVKGATINASFSSPALIPEANATVLTDNGSFSGRGFLNLSKSQIPINSSMTLDTQGLKIMQLVGFQIGIGIPKGDFVVDLQNDILNTTDLTSIFITLDSGFPLSNPISPSITNFTASKSVAILSAPIDAHITAHTLFRAKVVFMDCARISDKFFIARITLNQEGIECSLLVFSTFISAHSFSFCPQDTKNIVNIKGKNPGDVSPFWIIDNNSKQIGDVSDFWDVPTQPSSAKHYATFNSELIDKPILAGCPEGGVILDPFCGTGTTIARAIQLGRRGIGIDGSAEYCKIAKERISQKELF